MALGVPQWNGYEHAAQFFGHSAERIPALVFNQGATPDAELQCNVVPGHNDFRHFSDSG
jgi:hypothetical protein